MLFARAKRGRVVESEFERANRRPGPTQPGPALPGPARLRPRDRLHYRHLQGQIHPDQLCASTPRANPMPAGLALGACRDGGGAWRQRAVDATVGRIAARDQAGGRLAHGPAGERRLAPFLRRGHTRYVAVSVQPLVPAFSLRRWLTSEQGGYRTGITPPAI